MREKPLFTFLVPNNVVTLKSSETIKLVQEFNMTTGKWYYWLEFLDSKGRLRDRSLKLEVL
jgi:hypothetical protein